MGERSQADGLPPAALLVALGYAVLGLTWILVSDTVIEGLGANFEALRWLQTFKGSLFVLVTAVLLWGVLRGLLGRLDRARQALAQREDEWRAMFTEHPAPLFVVAPDAGRVRAANRAAARLYGRSIESLVGQRFGAFEALPEEVSAAEAGSPFAGLHRHLGSDGRTRWVDLHSAPIRYGGEAAALVSVLDLTAEREVHEALAFARTHDALTGLPNRRALLARLEGWFARRQPGQQAALVVLDLDGFRRIGQAWGGAATDEVLRVLAGRLRQACRPGDVLARTGLDEFALLLDGLEAGAAAEQAEALRERVVTPFALGEDRLGVTASVGVATTADRVAGQAESGPGEWLLRQAIAGLARAKAAGPGSVAFADARAQEEAAEALRGLADLRRALADPGGRELALRYQPVFDLRSGVPVAAEALAVWQHPTRGLLSAGQLVPLAEGAGLAGALGARLLARLLADGVAWRAAAPPGFRVFLNVSPLELRGAGFAEALRARVAAAGWLPEWLGLEITESAVVDAGGPARAELEGLHRAGFALALDDFGSGWSSLGALRDLPFDRVKVDATFVRGLPASTADANIVRAVVGLARGLGLEVVAEGIEGPGQRAAVAALGCGLGQGYGLARPMEAGALAALLGDAAAARGPAPGPAPDPASGAVRAGAGDELPEAGGGG